MDSLNIGGDAKLITQRFPPPRNICNAGYGPHRRAATTHGIKQTRKQKHWHTKVTGRITYLSLSGERVPREGNNRKINQNKECKTGRRHKIINSEDKGISWRLKQVSTRRRWDLPEWPKLIQEEQRTMGIIHLRPLPPLPLRASLSFHSAASLGLTLHRIKKVENTEKGRETLFSLREWQRPLRWLGECSFAAKTDELLVRLLTRQAITAHFSCAVRSWLAVCQNSVFWRNGASSEALEPFYSVFSLSSSNPTRFFPSPSVPFLLLLFLFLLLLLPKVVYPLISTYIADASFLLCEPTYSSFLFLTLIPSFPFPSRIVSVLTS